VNIQVITKEDKNKSRQRRHKSVRKKIQGTVERPRLNVFRSSKHMYAQLIDDVKGITLVASSTMDKEANLDNASGGNADAAQKVGELIAKRAKENGFVKVTFDRGGYLYHGRVKALADAAREAGLEF
jgi:large subunit ribosomal protein L18